MIHSGVGPSECVSSDPQVQTNQVDQSRSAALVQTSDAPSWSSVLANHQEFLSSFFRPASLPPTTSTTITSTEWKHPLLRNKTEKHESARKQPEVSPKRQELLKKVQQLQRQRCSLASEIAQMQSMLLLSSQQEKRRKVRVDTLVAQHGCVFVAPPEETKDPLPILNKYNLAQSLQSVRKKRKLTAACRLGGITAGVPHDDTEVLSIRFDICLNGTYVACYHAFFDLLVATATTGKRKKKRKGRPKKDVDNDSDSDSDMSSEDEESNPRKVYVRLTQHTIPSAIPLPDILETTLGGSLFFVGMETDAEWITHDFKMRLRLFCRKCFKACWCFEQRKQSWDFLTSNREETCPPDDACAGHFKVRSLSTPVSNALNQVSFQLSHHWCNPKTGVKLNISGECHVTLIYRDCFKDVPTEVRAEPTEPEDSRRVPSSTAPYLDHSFSQTVEKAFLASPVEKALLDIKQKQRDGYNLMMWGRTQRLGSCQN